MSFFKQYKAMLITFAALALACLALAGLGRLEDVAFFYRFQHGHFVADAMAVSWYLSAGLIVLLLVMFIVELAYVKKPRVLLVALIFLSLSVLMIHSAEKSTYSMVTSAEMSSLTVIATEPGTGHDNTLLLKNDKDSYLLLYCTPAEATLLQEGDEIAGLTYRYPLADEYCQLEGYGTARWGYLEEVYYVERHSDDENTATNATL